MFNKEILPLLVCPENRESLEVIEDSQLLILKEQFSAQTLKNIKGDLVSEDFETALVREDLQLAYLVRNSIPVLIFEEAIRLNDNFCQ